MKKSSDYTKDIRAKLWTVRILDFIFLALPLIVYLIISYVSGEVGSGKKIALTGLSAVALIVTIFNLLAQKHKRSPVWIMVIGLFIAMKDYLMPLVILLAIGSILDDFAFSPLITKYREKLNASKVYDERMAQPEEPKVEE